MIAFLAYLAGMLPALNDLTNVLLRVPDAREDAVKRMLDMLEILKELAERYQRQVDMVSAIICMESGVLEGEKVLGERHPTIKSMSRSVDKWSRALEPAESDMVRSLTSSECFVYGVIHDGIVACRHCSGIKKMDLGASSRRDL